MAEVLTVLQNVFTLAFVVSTMLAMGLSLTVTQIIEPLRNVRLVILALVANFFIVPAAAFVLSHLIPLAQPLQVGVLLLGTAAGAPLLPKWAQIAKANIAFAVGLMTVLMVVTVAYLPLVLPLLLPGVHVSAGKIALSLVLTMLVPLGIGLFVKARYSEAAALYQPTIAHVGNTSLILLLVLVVGLNVEHVIGLLGSGALLAVLLLTAVAVGSGYLLGGPGQDTRRVLGLGTGQRNVAAAFVVATGNFAATPDVLVLLAAAGLILDAIMIPLAGEFGRLSSAKVLGSARRPARAPSAPPQPA